MNVSRRYVVTIRKQGEKPRRITIPTLSDALEAAQTDARWLCGTGSVLVSPVLYVEADAKG